MISLNKLIKFCKYKEKRKKYSLLKSFTKCYRSAIYLFLSDCILMIDTRE